MSLDKAFRWISGWKTSVVSYGRYLLKTFWPENLAVIYPLPKLVWPRLALTAARPCLIVISWLGLARAAASVPYLPVGWLWFLGTLVPVIGIVQVGGQALADRYTYFPSIGIFIAVAFGLRELAEQFQIPKIIARRRGSCDSRRVLVLTENQLRYWRDSETLFPHALAVTKDNDVAHLNLGVALEEQRRTGRSAGRISRSPERSHPELYQTHNNIGNLLDNMGKPEAALAEYRKAVQLESETRLFA